MIGSLRDSRRKLVAGLLACVVFGSACAGVRPGADAPVPTPIVTPSSSNRPVFKVERGAVIQTIKGSGRVTSKDEATLYFTRSARLRRLYVDIGSQVNEGDVLAELDTADLQKQIDQQIIQLGIAELRLARAAETNSTRAALSEASAALAKAQADYRKALADLETVQAGPTVADIAAAEQRLASAQANLVKALNDHQKLVNGPSETDLREAEIEVERAHYSLLGAQANRDAVCGRDPYACRAENVRVGVAEAALAQAQQALDRLRAGATPEEIAVAAHNVESAKAAVAAAEADLAELKAGPKAVDILTAQKNVDSAREALASAQSAYDRQVALAQQGESFEVQLERKNVELLRLKLEALEAQLAASTIKAPFSGTVLSTGGREGEVLQAYTPVVVLANPNELQIAFDVPMSDLIKVAPDQDATIVLSAFPTEQFKGKVVKVPTLMAGAASPAVGDQQAAPLTPTVRIAFVDNPPRNLEIGSLANVSIAVQKKENVLIVPNEAIRTQGERRFVRLAEEGRRLPEVDVEVGLSDDLNTEVIRGLEEGQLVVQP